jgi:hypothetical protein
MPREYDETDRRQHVSTSRRGRRFPVRQHKMGFWGSSKTPEDRLAEKEQKLEELRLENAIKSEKRASDQEKVLLKVERNKAKAAAKEEKKLGKERIREQRGIALQSKYVAQSNKAAAKLDRVELRAERIEAVNHAGRGFWGRVFRRPTPERLKQISAEKIERSYNAKQHARAEKKAARRAKREAKLASGLYRKTWFGVLRKKKPKA